MMKASTTQRHYGMDWLRIGAFVLLIFYHIGINFTPWGYTTPTRGVVPWAEIPLLATSAWRLGLLFAISGYSSAALLAREKSDGAFLRSRLVRLGVPLLFALIVIVPPQPYAGLVHGGYTQSYLYYFVHDAFTFQNIRGEYVPRPMHMWFVIYLLTYTLVLAAALKLPLRVRQAAGQVAERVLAGPWLLPAGIAIIFAVRLFPGNWTDSHEFFRDPVAHVHYCLLFFFGILLRRSEKLRLAIAAQWKLGLALGVGAFALVAADAIRYPGNVPTPGPLLVPLHFAKAVQCWGMIVALFGIADRFWNRDNRWRAMLAEAVFPFYIVHQTAEVCFGYWLRDKGLTALPEFLALMTVTFAACWAFYLGGRELRWLRPLIGLSPRRDRAAPSPPAADLAPVSG
ncbi:acyltransferase [Novosphingobium colocasiae]|uniref:acyltransferase family protein n=1 Tax=Novosphingobium colocasiae TaxID=1256513 RepID=UPI0035ADB399